MEGEVCALCSRAIRFANMMNDEEVGMPMEAGRKDPPHQGTAGGTQQRKNARRTGAKYDVQ